MEEKYWRVDAQKEEKNFRYHLNQDTKNKFKLAKRMSDIMHNNRETEQCPATASSIWAPGVGYQDHKIRTASELRRRRQRVPTHARQERVHLRHRGRPAADAAHELARPAAPTQLPNVEARVAVVSHRHILGALTGLYPAGVSQRAFDNAFGHIGKKTRAMRKWKQYKAGTIPSLV